MCVCLKKMCNIKCRQCFLNISTNMKQNNGCRQGCKLIYQIRWRPLCCLLALCHVQYNVVFHCYQPCERYQQRCLRAQTGTLIRHCFAIYGAPDATTSVWLHCRKKDLEVVSQRTQLNQTSKFKGLSFLVCCSSFSIKLARDKYYVDL